MRGFGTLLLVVYMTCFLPAAAAATPPDVETLQQQARKLFSEGNYPGAIEVWEQVRVLRPDPQYTLNIAVAWHKLGRLVYAWEGYQEFLRDSKDEDKGARVQEFVLQIEESLQATHVPVTLRVDPGSGWVSLQRDGQTLKRAGELRTWLEPGSYTVSAGTAGYQETTRVIRIALGKPRIEILHLTKEPVAELPTVPDPDPNDGSLPEEAPGRISSRQIPTWVPWTLVATGVAMGGIGLGLNLAGVDTAHDANTHPDAPDYDANWRRAENLALASYALYGIGGATALSGAILFIVNRPRTGEPTTARGTPQPTWSVIPTPFTPGLLLQLGF